MWDWIVKTSWYWCLNKLVVGNLKKKGKQRKENGSCIYNLTKGLFGIFFAWQAEKKN